MMHTLRRGAVWILLFAAATWAGCGPTLDRLSQGSILEGGAPFPDFEEAAPAAPAAERIPRLPLAGLFDAELAEAGWQWYAQDSVTVLVHQPDNGEIDALVYAETWPDRMATDPGAEARRFLLTVDPALVQSRPGWSPGIRKLAAALPAAHEADRDLNLRVVGLASTRTGGRGLGYVSSQESFSGWKWIGRNRQGVFLRLALSRGTWGDPGTLDPALGPAVDRLVKSHGGLAWMREGLPAGGTTAPESRRTPEPAYMVFGSAAGSAGGVHLALLCARRPACGPVRDLARLLDSLQPAASGELPEAGPATSEGLSIDHGIVVEPREAVLVISR